jgi:hypothetical protein
LKVVSSVHTTIILRFYMNHPTLKTPFPLSEASAIDLSVSEGIANYERDEIYLIVNEI